MPVHIFQVNETNFEICKKKGLAGIFSIDKEDTDETILSHMMLLKKGDPVLFYVGKGKNNQSKKELHGVWIVSGDPFYDPTPVWPDKEYPYRVRIEEKKGAMFGTPLKLSDIYRLRDIGKIWSFSLMRNSKVVNAVFSLTNIEFAAIFDEFIKLNPSGGNESFLTEPYIAPITPLLNRLRIIDGKPKYEATVMALLAHGFINRSYNSILQNYNDYSIYVPTNWGKEIDFLLMHSHPYKTDVISSYDIIEVKRDKFDETGLMQLLSYESWFINTKVKGDANMIRSIAIAKDYSNNVVKYLKARDIIEKKQVVLLSYSINRQKEIELTPFRT